MCWRLLGFRESERRLVIGADAYAVGPFHDDFCPEWLQSLKEERLAFLKIANSETHVVKHRCLRFWVELPVRGARGLTFEVTRGQRWDARPVRPIAVLSIASPLAFAAQMVPASTRKSCAVHMAASSEARNTAIRAT